MKKTLPYRYKPRQYCIITHNRLERGRVKFEKELGKLMRRYGFSFIGSGYDTTNKRRDIEWRRDA